LFEGVESPQAAISGLQFASCAQDPFASLLTPALNIRPKAEIGFGMVSRLCLRLPCFIHLRSRRRLFRENGDLGLASNGR
jgi:hypothetical protein